MDYIIPLSIKKIDGVRAIASPQVAKAVILNSMVNESERYLWRILPAGAGGNQRAMVVRSNSGLDVSKLDHIVDDVSSIRVRTLPEFKVGDSLIIEVLSNQTIIVDKSRVPLIGKSAHEKVSNTLLNSGFDIINASSDSRLPLSFRKGGHNVNLGQTLTNAHVRIVDAKANVTLQNGIGRGKAYGLGLILVKGVVTEYPGFDEEDQEEL